MGRERGWEREKERNGWRDREGGRDGKKTGVMAKLSY
jgi:hypothetical protein